MMGLYIRHFIEYVALFVCVDIGTFCKRIAGPFKDIREADEVMDSIHKEMSLYRYLGEKNLECLRNEIGVDVIDVQAREVPEVQFLENKS